MDFVTRAGKPTDPFPSRPPDRLTTVGPGSILSVAEVCTNDLFRISPSQN